jgi:hypothetical protein
VGRWARGAGSLEEVAGGGRGEVGARHGLARGGEKLARDLGGDLDGERERESAVLRWMGRRVRVWM